MDEINYMLSDMSVPEELATRCRSYWRAAQHLTRLRGYHGLKELLSAQLQGELAFYAGAERSQRTKKRCNNRRKGERERGEGRPGNCESMRGGGAQFKRVLGRGVAVQVEAAQAPK